MADQPDVNKIISDLSIFLSTKSVGSSDFLPRDRDVIKVISTFDTAGFTLTGFDYNKWISESKIDIQNIDNLDQHDLETMRKIITAHIRINRFVDGHLNKLIDNGFIQSFVQSLNRFL
ncbi:MAG: DUF6508 domain-containing protein [Bacteroidales bacterium]|jgi:hypothetical protein|nr:DUF6508 domain-containing protein [Bacteroidales bacterium]